MPRLLWLRRVSFFAAFALLVTGVGAGWSHASEQAAQAGMSQPQSPPPAQAAGGIDVSGYQLGAGDKVRVIVFGEDSLTGEFLVPGGAGVISFPLIGDVQASGLTVDELQREIETKLKDGYLKEPHVSIEVLNYRPFYILGEVQKPGEYPYTNGLTVLNAVATANGFTYRADKRHVFIRRANESKETEYPLSSATAVDPGDTIRIGERFF